MTFYIAEDDQQRGPFGIDELRSRGLQPDTLVWREGMPSWDRADTVAELRPLFAGGDVASPTVSPAAAVPPPPAAIAPLQYDAGPAAYAPGGYGNPPASGMAVASMVLGILALPLGLMSICLWWIAVPMTVTGVILGHVARSHARQGRAGGASMAMAGLVCGYIALGLTALSLIMWFFIFIQR